MIICTSLRSDPSDSGRTPDAVLAMMRTELKLSALQMKWALIEFAIRQGQLETAVSFLDEQVAVPPEATAKA
jgi:hypothetical protein